MIKTLRIYNVSLSKNRQMTILLSFLVVFPSNLDSSNLPSNLNNIHVFCPAQDSSVWLGLTSREQLMWTECLKLQILSLANMVLVNEQNIFCFHQCSPEWSMNKLWLNYGIHWIPFRRSQSQLCTITPVSSFVRCLTSFQLLPQSVATFLLIKFLLR